MSAVHFVDIKEIEPYLCAICHNVMNNPCQIGCKGSHVFCKQCINQAITTSNHINPKCAVCSTRYAADGLTHIPFIQKRINELKVKCPNHISVMINNNAQHNNTKTPKNHWILKNQSSKKRKILIENDALNAKKQKLNKREYCNWMGQFGDLENHINVCDFQLTNCKFLRNGCKRRLKRKNIRLHVLLCQYAPTLCSVCRQKTVIRCKLSNHYQNECVMRTVICNNNGCNQQMRQNEIKQHQLICGFGLVACDYTKFGCQKIQRKNKETHNQEFMQRHLKLVTDRYAQLERKKSDQIQVLKQQNDILLKENVSLKYGCPKCKSDLIGKCADLLGKVEVKCSKCNIQQVGTVWYCENCPHWIVCGRCRYY